MWVVVGEQKMDRETWGRYHALEEERIWEVERHGWLYEETYEKYCEAFDKAKGELFDEVEGVARVRNKLYVIPYGEEWEEECDFYSDYHKDVYGYRPRDIGEIMRERGITREMREVMYKKRVAKMNEEYEKGVAK